MKNPPKTPSGDSPEPSPSAKAPTSTMAALANIIPIWKALPPVTSQPNGSNANKENLNER